MYFIKTLKTTILIFAVLLLLFGCTSKKHEDGVTKEEIILNSTTGEIEIQHTEGYITTDTTGMQLWYDTFGDRDNPKVFLIHGTDAQAVNWMPHLYEPLVNAGYCVIRFDQRGNGLSEIFPKPKGFKPQKWTPEQAPPYTFVDMADDAIGLLEKLDIEAAHVVGHSMGGMIAQLVAIRRPDMVKTLTLLASSPSHSFDETYQSPETLEFFMNDLAGTIRKMAMPSMLMPLTRKKMITLTKVFFGSMDKDFTTPHGEEMLDEYVNAYYSGGRKFNLMSWQGMAVATSKSRADELKKLNIPALVVHGDEDMLLDYANGKALASLIPEAKLITIKGGGHLFPLLDTYNDEYIDDLINHLRMNN
ncbi:MAG: alpha/beta hydrolase [Spirochaetota bacterium]|nr:MAG: alpha/beta hydrolase [Spirochaetota bacterium]